MFSYETARSILGDDLITPEEIVSAGARFPGKTREWMVGAEQTMPLEDELHWCRNNGFMVVVGPPVPLNLCRLFGEGSGFFGGGFFPERTWFYGPGNASEPVAFEEVHHTWSMFRKGPVQGSEGKEWEEQITLLGDREEVPLTVEVVWGAIISELVRGTRLFAGGYVRTRSLTQTAGSCDAQGQRSPGEPTRVFVGRDGKKLIFGRKPTVACGLASCRRSSAER